jgi:bacterioferritin
MLHLAVGSEHQAVAQFNASAKECHDLGDHGTAAMFEEMVREEERHADWFESQVAAIERVGAAAYLAATSIPPRPRTDPRRHPPCAAGAHQPEPRFARSRRE